MLESLASLNKPVYLAPDEVYLAQIPHQELNTLVYSEMLVILTYGNYSQQLVIVMRHQEQEQQ
jgi:hypothetical protein